MITEPLARWVFGRACRNVERYIFVASTGRSGTTSTQRILSVIDDLASVHEPFPQLCNTHWPLLQQLEAGDERPIRNAFSRKKLLEIYRAARGHRWYVESNYQFIHYFADYACEQFPRRLGVLHLSRDPIKVSLSHYNHETVPGHTPVGIRRMPHYRADRNLIQVAPLLEPGGRFEHPFFAIVWFWYETEARMRDFVRRHPDVPVSHLTTDQLNDLDAVYKAITHLGIEVDRDKLAGAVGTRENVSDSPAQVPQEVSNDELRAFRNICRAALDRIGPPFDISPQVDSPDA
ncbi:MAG: hypothetical protein GC162_13035 [Planctomycetes bacterium]|nr:hypothetical protein [Planctomycetota bacterium]